MTSRVVTFARWSAPALVCALGGCVPVGEEVGLLVPGAVDVTWDERFDGVDDGRVALVPVDVMVYEAASGAPVAGAPVVVAVVGVDAGLVDPEGVAWVDEPDCDGSTESCVDFDPVWDAWRDRYAVLSDEPVASFGLRTDARGMARIYVWVDGFDASGATPPDPGSHPVAVVVSSGDVEDSFFLVAR